MKSISEFIEKRKKIFEKVVFRLYDCHKSKHMIIFNLGRHTMSFLDDISAQLFCLLASASLEELLLFVKRNNFTEEEILEFIYSLCDEKILNSLYEKACLPTCETLQESISDIDDFYETLFISGYLFALHIDITCECNLRCKHCYHTFENYKRDTSKQMLSFERIKQVIDEAQKLGVFKVTLSGGEPMLHPNIHDILEYISHKNMIIDLYTNATLLNKTEIEKLAKYNVNKVSISLYSSNSKKHDGVTQGNSFEPTIQAIQRLKQHNIMVELKSVLMSETFAEYKQLQQFAENLGCTLILDATMTSKLDGTKKPLEYTLTKEQYKQLCLNSEKRKLSTFTINPNARPCNAGRYGLYIDWDGCIYPCVSLRIKLGDSNSLVSVWKENRWLKEWANTKNADFVDYGKYSFCKYCRIICAGIALLENGDMWK